jgi:hypothetical protein
MLVEIKKKSDKMANQSKIYPRVPDELSQLEPSHELSQIKLNRVGKILACNHELSHGPSHGSSHGSDLTRFIDLRVRLAKEVKEKQ